jgi:hypothetical protein
LIFVQWLPLTYPLTGKTVPKLDRLPMILPFAVVPCIATLLVKLPLISTLLGNTHAVAFFGIGRVVRHRPYYALSGGWCVAGLVTAFAVTRIERFTLFFLLGGVVTLLYGAWDYASHTTNHRAAQP